MKKPIFFTLALTLTLTLFSQVPQMINYQLVVRDSSAAILSHQPVSLRLSILSGSAGGTAVYSESHQVTTNPYGLINLRIGEGTVQSGSFAGVNWASAAHYLKVELDPAGGTNYQLMGTQQLVSVPYALYAETAGGGGDSDSTNELQSLTRIGNTVYLSKGGGSFTDNFNDADADPGNELQSLSRVGNQILLSSGGSVTDMVDDNDADPLNEIQSLSLANDALSISGSNSVSLYPYKSHWTRNINDLYYSSGNVMLGTGSPTQLLTVNGNLSINDHIEKYGDPTTYIQLPNGHVKLFASGNSMLDAYGGSNRYVKLGDGGLCDINLNDDVWVDATNGFLGIGTNNPQTNLHVSNSLGAGFILESASGVYMMLDRGSSGTANATINFRRNGSTQYTLGTYFGDDLRLFGASSGEHIIDIHSSTHGIFMNSAASSTTRLLTLKPGDDFQGGISVDYNRTGSGPIWGVDVDIDMNSSITAGATGVNSSVRREGSGTGETIGVWSYATDAQNSLFGSRYSYGTKSHAWASYVIGTTYAYGLYGFAGNADYNYGVYYSGGLAGSGTKSAVVRTASGPKAVYCQESPENWFEDFGGGTITNGKGRIQLAADFLETVRIDAANPMRVFITPTGDMGEFWVEKGDAGFTVHAPSAANGAGFDYRVVAKRKGYENLRLEPAPAAYTDHHLYPEIRDVPAKFRLQWVKMLPEEQWEEYFSELTAEEVELLNGILIPGQKD